ncbi:MAG: glycosyltransferase family 4 protein [Planctomycetales bacterium]|nr:glycosyltransferase family 4 protein [Planctomycetales bacterium]
MRIWLITVAEPLPIDSENARLLRTGILAEALAAKGHEVVWWTSTFDHFAKKNRFGEDTCVTVRDGYEVRMLYGNEYKKNISLARIRNHRQVAKAFWRLASEAEPPEVILCSMPTVELSLAAARFGGQRSIPVLLDLRDLWPDIFVDHVPRLLRPVVNWATVSMRRDLAEACRSAFGLVGMTEEFLDWGLEYAGRPRHTYDQVIPLAYRRDPPPVAALDKANAFWKEKKIGIEPEEFVVCFFGNLSKRYELHNVIHAAKLLNKRSVRCRFVLCGKGEDMANCQRLAAGQDNVCFPGWVGAAEIWTLMRKSKLGIVPYPSSRDFVRSIPNKAIEYLSAGLPIITSLSGTLQKLVETEACGVRYQNGDAEMLADAVAGLATDPGLLAQMSANAEKLFADRFVAEKVYPQLISCLEELAHRHRRVRQAA